MDQISNFLNLPFKDPVLIFSLILSIILFAPLIFDKIKIPHIVGLILAGALFGPNGLDVLAYDSSFQLFGQVGVLYIIFLAGIGVDMNDFKENKNKSIVFGMYTFIIPMLLGTITGIVLMYLIYNNLSGGEPITWVSGEVSDSITLIKYCSLSAIVLASMYASNTLLAYPIVTRFGVSHNRSVNIAVGGTIITTVLALLVLAVVLEIIRGDMSYLFWLKFIVSLSIFGFIIFYIFPRIARWFFKRYADNVLQYIFVLAMVFFASFLAKLAGIEYIIGAFLAGLTLNRLVPKQSPLMNRIDFVGNAIFIPFFLISVGMIVNFRILFDGYLTLLTAVLMSVIATLAKYLAAKAAGKTFKMSDTEESMIFGLTNAHAAAALAVVMIAYNFIIGYNASGEVVRLLSEEILNGTIIMILVTCVISSIVTERASKKIAISDMSNEKAAGSYKPEHRILIPISNPHTLNSLMELAVLIRNKNEKQPIYALSVMNDDNYKSQGAIGSQKLLEKAVSLGAATDNKVKMISRYDLNIASGISNVVKEKNISDVVMGLHNKTTLSDSFFGSMTDALLSGVNRMICIFKSTQPMGTIKRVVVAVPADAEKESGFNKWCDRVFTLSEHIDAELVFYCNANTTRSIASFGVTRKNHLQPKFMPFENWDEFMTLKNAITSDDLLVVISARKQSPSYQTSFEKLPIQLSENFQANSFIVLYPEQFKEGEFDQMENSTTKII
ncbi:MAG: cation:proton antiporter [Bacteroidia bacterium]|nr:cation:proton antiporter [Bacteroidia bacterium]